MSQFVINLNLTNIYNDHRRFAKILVQEKFQYIKDIKKHISYLFPIDNFDLTCENHYLPPLEDVRILKNDDCVFVIPSNRQEIDDNPILNSVELPCNGNEFDLNQSTEDNSTETAAEKKKKKKKRKNKLKENNEKNNLETDRENEVKNVENDTISSPELVAKKPRPIRTYRLPAIKKNNIVKSIIVSPNLEDTNEPANPEIGEDNTKTETDSGIVNDHDEIKKKRKRVRKRKHKKSTSSFKEQLQLLVDSMKQSKQAPTTHIRFDDCSDEMDKDETSKIQIEEILNDVEKIDGDCNSVELNKNVPLSDDFIDKQLRANLETLKCGDIISFKILRITEQYTPEISSYITGKITNIDKNNAELSLIIFHGADQCVEPQGKFSIETEENSQIPPEQTFQFSVLLDPRLIYP